jgi:hypothetical protein
MDEEIAAPNRATGAKGLGLGSAGKGLTLPTLGPVYDQTVITDPVNGYVYRNNPTFAENFDKIEVMVNYRILDLTGFIAVAANPSVIISLSAIEDVYNTFWSQIYTLLHEMAQKRDGYKASDDSLTTALNVVYRDSTILSVKINIRVLWALYHGTMVNEGLKSMIPAFAGKRSRLQRILELSNTLIYPQEFDALIDYWSTVFSPYPGGPITVNLFDVAQYARNDGAGLLDPATGMHEWTAPPDWTSSADIGYLLDDLEKILGLLTRYTSDTDNINTDLRLIHSLYSMMGFPTPQTGVKGITIDPAKFQEQYRRYGYYFADTKGAGTDTHVFWPDCRGDLDNLLNIYLEGHPFDILDMIGAKGIYAWDADDDDTPGYSALANDLSGYGLVGRSQWESANLGGLGLPYFSWYTREDGWVTNKSGSVGSYALDLTAAAGLQKAFWAIPWITVHPDGWRIIASEEAEEAYRFGFDERSGGNVQIPFDHFGQAYRKWIYAAYKIPYIT